MGNRAQRKDSFVRRMEFAGNAKYFFSKLFSHKFILSLLPIGWPSTLSNIFLRISSIVYDLIESLRLLTLVPAFGDYRKLIVNTYPKLRQHKKYPSFKYYPKNNTLIGVHLGVDLIRHKGFYYLLEMNFDAGMRKQMRDLSPNDIDPIVENYARFAQEAGFSKVRLVNSVWNPYFAKEIAKAQSKYSLDIKAIKHLGTKPSKEVDWVKIPDVLEKNTLYSFFCSRHTPIDFLLHNKLGLESWIHTGINNYGEKISLLKSIPCWFRFDLPDTIFQEQYWPQFVAKLSGWDAGKQIKVIKAKNLHHAKEILGIKSPDDFPKIFKMNLVHKILGKISSKNSVLYQKYIPLEMDEKKRLRSFRMHAFFAPKTSLFLSTQALHGSKPIKDNIPFGIAPLDGSFISTVTHGAFYKAASKSEHVEQEELCQELGLVLDGVISKKFHTSP